MLIALTGATGFIGGHVARRLLDSGHQVRALVRPSSNAEQLTLRGADVRKGDLNEQDFIDACLDGCELLINSAGQLGKWGISEDELKRANVSMVECLINSAQKAGIRQFIHFSTPGVVGMVGVAPECMPMRPAGAYERTKTEAEKLALTRHKNGDVAITLLRPDFVYGPGDLHKLKMFKAIKGKRFPIMGGGKSLLHPTYIDDVVDGLMLVLDNEAAFGQTFNLAGPSPVMVREMVECVAADLRVQCWNLSLPPALLKLGVLGVEMVCCAAKKEPPVTRQQICFFTRDHASDISKAREILGYSPKVDINEGIKRTIAWYEQEGYL